MREIVVMKTKKCYRIGGFGGCRFIRVSPNLLHLPNLPSEVCYFSRLTVTNIASTHLQPSSPFQGGIGGGFAVLAHRLGRGNPYKLNDKIVTP